MVLAPSYKVKVDFVDFDFIDRIIDERHFWPPTRPPCTVAKVEIRLPAKGNSNVHGARPVY